ncbi:MAG: hypothetical protein M9894_37485 [Planctomycetes bacterium]|nr:hypothetical protein [Planctomycetota bacterium]
MSASPTRSRPPAGGPEVSRPAGAPARAERARRGALAAACALLLVAGCGSEELAPEPERLRRAPELAGGPPARVDFWTDTLGDYLGPDFRAAPADERFARFGLRLLEFRLREDLLEEHRWALSQQDVDTFAGQPDHDASERFLREVLGAEPR